MKITKVFARQVLDSRGNPTVEADVHIGKFAGRAIVPSGASTGTYEALEMRDREKAYLGAGVSKAVRNVNNIIAKKLLGMKCEQKLIDSAMIKLDGTPNKSRLGANAILAVSMAAMRAAAAQEGVELYEHVAKVYKKKPSLPVPVCNLINGGKHAGTSLHFQEFMVLPVGARSMAEAVQMVSETYHTLKKRIEAQFGKSAVNVGDEGGFTPQLKTAEQALSLISGVTSELGYENKLRVGVDAAASEFFVKGHYALEKEYSPEQLLAYYKKLHAEFGLYYAEDVFEQDDFHAFARLKRAIGDSCQVVGDDLTVTNVDRLHKAIGFNAINGMILKLNQIGTVSESIDAYELCSKHGITATISHRSGESEDTFIADLACGLGARQIKLGAPCRGERTAKLNQLMRIEERLGSKARYPG